MDEVDALVIGSGPSGAVVAHELSSAGFSVVALERGHWHPYENFEGTGPEASLAALRKWNFNPNTRAAPADYLIDTSDTDVCPLMFSGVGGTALIYGAHWLRFLPSDFRVRSLDGVGDDWPLTYDDLVPFYGYIEEQMGVSGLAGNPAYPDGAPAPLPPLPLNRIGRTAVQGLDNLGWHWWPGSNAIASRQWRGLNACTLRGLCAFGCAEGAKATPDRTHWPAAMRNGAKLITGARVNEVTVNSRGRATGAVYVDSDGQSQHQKASMVILCANAIGTPRLLLMSASGKFPDGLANRSGLVGKRLMTHAYGSVVGVFDSPLESWLGPAGQVITSLQFYETDAARGFVRGAKWNAMPTGGPQQCALRDSDGPLSANWGAAFHSKVRSQFGRSFEWGIIGEDLPEESNTVTLSDTLVDEDGLPCPKVHYKTSANTRKLIDFHVARACEAMDAAGAVEVSIKRDVRESGWHLMGTACMGTDPETSVVDPWGRCHDIPNLFVLDGSVFVTSSGMNPTPTVMALAARGALNIIESAGEVT